MNSEDAYLIALKVYVAGLNGEPMPEVPSACAEVCKKLWLRARRSAYIA